MIWQKSLLVEEHASDLAELPVPVIWQNCLHVDKHASDLAELPVPVFGRIVCLAACASDLAELSVCVECASDLAE